MTYHRPDGDRPQALHDHYARNAIATGHGPHCDRVLGSWRTVQGVMVNWPTLNGRMRCTCGLWPDGDRPTVSPTPNHVDSPTNHKHDWYSAPGVVMHRVCVTCGLGEHRHDPYSDTYHRPADCEPQDHEHSWRFGTCTTCGARHPDAPTVSVPRAHKAPRARGCKYCGQDLRGMAASDRGEHTVGRCGR